MKINYLNCRYAFHSNDKIDEFQPNIYEKVSQHSED